MGRAAEAPGLGDVTEGPIAQVLPYLIALGLEAHGPTRACAPGTPSPPAETAGVERAVVQHVWVGVFVPVEVA